MSHIREKERKSPSHQSHIHPSAQSAFPCGTLTGAAGFGRKLIAGGDRVAVEYFICKSD